MNDSLRRFLVSWHWVWVIGAGLIAWASLTIGDPRPLLVAFWWSGFALLGLIFLAGLIGSVVVMIVGIRQNLARRRERRKT